MTRPLALAAALIAVMAAGTVVTRASSQQQPSSQTELLTEVRLLRQAIESLAGTNARVQIVFGRLQLQEQRTDAAARRLDQVRDSLNGLTSPMSMLAEHEKQLEAAIEDTRRKPEEIAGARAELAGIRPQLDAMEQTRMRLATEEADAAATLSQEQGRWSELNRQLDELERLLSKR